MTDGYTESKFALALSLRGLSTRQFWVRWGDGDETSGDTTAHYCVGTSWMSIVISTSSPIATPPDSRTELRLSP